MLARQTARLGNLAGGGAQEIRKSGEIGFGLEHQHIVALVGEHVLAESGAERCEPLADLGQARLGRGLQVSAGAPEHGLIALQYTLLLIGQRQRCGFPEHVLDLSEQVAVQIDLVVMRREPWRDFALDRLDGIVGMSARQGEKHIHDLRQLAAGALQRGYGVFEVRLGRISEDRCYLCFVLRHGLCEGRQELLRHDVAEGRHLEFAYPGGKKWIGSGPGGPNRGGMCVHGTEISLFFGIEGRVRIGQNRASMRLIPPLIRGHV